MGNVGIGNWARLSAVLLVVGLGALTASAERAEITIEKPYFRWLFGGFGYQNNEANLTALMGEDFLNERVLKTFHELSPTFARVHAGYANISKDAMDRFADYYHKTFARAGTMLYAVPGRMPAFPDQLDVEEYAEKVAKNLTYLVKEKGVRTLRYYGLTNEMSAGDRWGYFHREKKMDVFKSYYAALHRAFARHGLDILLVATDYSATRETGTIEKHFDWCLKNMDDYVGIYCSHAYVGGTVDDLRRWEDYGRYYDGLVQMVRPREKRYFIGELGFKPVEGQRKVMVDDTDFEQRLPPEKVGAAVLSKLELCVAAMNAGTYACASWSFVDFPDPMTIVDGHTSEEHAKYEALHFCHRMDMRYNKWGAFRWSDVDKDYSAKAELYAYGHLVKLFRRDATVLPSKSTEPLLRTGSVLNPDGSVSLVVINRGEVREATISCAQALKKPMRLYVYEADNMPRNAFNDLQPHRALVKPTDAHTFTVKVPASAAVFLTTDYIDRVPSPIVDMGLKDDGRKLCWAATRDAEHRYYRVFRKGEQVASTVATEIKIPEGATVGEYQVKSVDKWGNVGK